MSCRLQPADAGQEPRMQRVTSQEPGNEFKGKMTNDGVPSDEDGGQNGGEIDGKIRY